MAIAYCDEHFKATKKLYLLLAILYTAFVVYGSLVPLEFEYKSFEDAWRVFTSIPFLQLEITSRADWVANGLLFIPLTFLWMSIFHRRHDQNTPWPVGQFLAIAFLACLLSMAIEFTQIFFPQRTLSQNDIIAESIGGIIGLGAWFFYSAKVDDWFIRFVSDESVDRRWRNLLIAYVAGLFLYNVMPLDLILSPVEFYHKWKEGRILLNPIRPELWLAPEKWFELITDIILWVPLAVFLCLTKKRHLKEIILWVLGAVVVIEFLQLFVYSRTSDAHDLLTGLLGALLGGLLCKQLGILNRQTSDGMSLAVLNTNKLWAAYVMWMSVLVVIFWYPFEFTTDKRHIQSAIENFFGVLFKSYYFRSEYHALTELLRKVLLFVPLGILTQRLANYFSRQAVVLWFVSIAAAIIIETGQIALEDKTANLTDALLMLFGIFIGRSIAGYLWSYRQASTHRQSDAKKSYAQPYDQSRQGLQNDPSPWFLGILFVVVFAGLFAVSHIESLPYNVKELYGSYRLGGSIAIAMILVWLFCAPAYVVHQVEGKNVAIRLSMLLFLHISIFWLLVRAFLPMESIHDILGAPVWAIHREIELYVRFFAFWAWVVCIIMAANIWLMRRQQGNSKQSMVVSLLWFLTALVLCYVVTIRMAGTDNVIELLAFEGRSIKVLAIPLYFVFTYFSCAMLIQNLTGSLLKLSMSILVVFLTGVLGYQLVRLGTEEFIFKYEQVFSALQFLFSASRDVYIPASELFYRFLAAHSAFVVLILGLSPMFWQGVTTGKQSNIPL